MIVTLIHAVIAAAVVGVGYKYRASLKAEATKLKADITPAVAQLEAAVTKDEATAKAEVAKVVAYIKTKI